MTKLVVKERFKSEADEAQWWAKNQDAIADAFEQASAEGTLGRGSVAKKGLTPTTTIR